MSAIVDLMLAELDDEALAALAQRLKPYLHDGADPGTLLTPSEAAERLAVHPRTLTRAASAGRVSGAVRVGKGWRFKAAELRLAAPASRTPSPPPPPPRARSASSSAAQAIRGER